MATSLLTLLDDISTVLDDVAVMTKIATRKTAGVLGDDLALNANQVAGVRAHREIPVVAAVARGSAINKLILVPVALAISAIAPWAITPLLMLGGLYLCYEGVEKLAHKFLYPARSKAELATLRENVANTEVDLATLEKTKIKGAIRTDFILSAEIIVISLGTVAAASFSVRLGVLIGISVIMTIGVYGLVAGIVKLDDLGHWLVGAPAGASNTTPQRSAISQATGRGILWFAPWLMKTLSVVGTAAMFIVGGGIITHGFHGLTEWILSAAGSVGGWLPSVSSILSGLTSTLLQTLVGVLAGVLALGVVTVATKATGATTRH